MAAINDVIFKLTHLGFSSYEAKAYFALLQKHPVIGYEVSKIAKIPTAKIYETLANLKNKGAVIANSSEPVLYSPVDPDILLRRIKKEFTDKIDELDDELTKVQPIENIDITWNLIGYDNVTEKIANIINKASEQLLLSIWPEEAVLLKNEIDEAVNRGVKVIAGIFGEIKIEGVEIINIETCGVTSEKRLGNRLTVAAGDSKEVVIAQIGDCKNASGVWTSTPCIVLAAKEYIRHDIWGKILIDALGIERFSKMVEEDPLVHWLINNN